ncbi:GntR family transcriptional regulator [Pseudalkalibacillus hwajinpoensis]|uniref:GntR family transcriptional regulator n=1 Tax=Guptibacillus hwajinpoensis TaxID=208199 RepID=UPI001CFE5AA4|nr:GntR family transcriptional regulator [Pseudalkalibacillus hwajinpoensis]
MSTPLYRKIAGQLKEDITNGTLRVGEAIPTEAHLSNHYKASRVTIRQAIQTLVEEGLLEKVQGSGTYVSEKKIEHNIFELQSFTEEMKRLNKTPVNRVIDFQLKAPSDQVKRMLQISEDEKVFYVRRQRLVDDVPYVLEDTYLPVSMFPNLSYQIMSGSKYDYIEKEKGMKIKESFQEIIPILPDEDISMFLEVDSNLPILKVQLYSIFQDSTVFEYSEIYFKSDEYKFTLRASRPGN